MYDSAFLTETENSLSMGAPQRPPEKGLFDGMGKALKNFAPAAIAETSRALEGFSSLAGINRQEDGLRAELRQQGINIPSFSQSIGQDIKRLTPDPETTGAAAQVVFGFGKVLTKAAALGGLGGLPAAAGGTSLIEGTVEAQRLQDEGVDPATAAKVGAVRGVSTAVSVALPAAGKTLAGTAALVIGGGPVSFMAEQEASKRILDAADYRKVAEQYDPFDPVGLTIATLLPAAVGGVALRGARRAKAKAEAEIVPTPEEVAAARVVQTAETIQQSGLHAKGDIVGAAAHVDALELARRQLDSGERVNVADMVQKVQDAEAARIAAEAKPGFLRTADDLVAMKRQEYPYLTPELARVLEIAQMPGAFRSAEDRIFLQGMLRQGEVPTAKAPDTTITEPPRVPDTAKAAETPENQAEQAPAAEVKAVDSIEQSARQIAETRPDLQITDEFTGQVVSAKKLLDDADADFKQDTQDARVFDAAVACFLRH